MIKIAVCDNDEKEMKLLKDLIEDIMEGYAVMYQIDTFTKGEAIERLAMKYHPTDSAENRNQEIARTWKALCMMELSVEHMTGKEAIETAQKK